MPVSDGDIGPRRLRPGDIEFHNLTIDGGGRLYLDGQTTSTSTSSNFSEQTYPAEAKIAHYQNRLTLRMEGPAERTISTSTFDQNRTRLQLGSTWFQISQYTTEPGPSGTTGPRWVSLIWGGRDFSASTFTGIAVTDLDVGGRLLLSLQTASTVWNRVYVTRSTDVDSNGLHYLVASTWPSTWQ